MKRLPAELLLIFSVACMLYFANTAVLLAVGVRLTSQRCNALAAPKTFHTDPARAASWGFSTAPNGAVRIPIHFQCITTITERHRRAASVQGQSWQHLCCLQDFAYCSTGVHGQWTAVPYVINLLPRANHKIVACVQALGTGSTACMCIWRGRIV